MISKNCPWQTAPEGVLLTVGSHSWVSYMENTGHKKRCQIIKTDGHEMMPNFVGVWFPRNNIEELQDFYYASVLVLLQPWKDIADLKRYDETNIQAGVWQVHHFCWWNYNGYHCKHPIPSWVQCKIPSLLLNQNEQEPCLLLNSRLHSYVWLFEVKKIM